MKTSPLLIVGLGNPGSRYENTRHNIGFMVLDNWLRLLEKEITWKKEPSPLSLLAKLPTKSGYFNLALKPQTFMNNSGQSVSEVLNYFKLTPDNLLVIHDDLDLPLGTYRASDQATAAGHNGVQSIIDALGTKNWLRLRLGIGHPTDNQPTEDYVLRPFAPDELLAQEKILPASADYLNLYLSSPEQKLKSLRNLTGKI